MLAHYLAYVRSGISHSSVSLRHVAPLTDHRRRYSGQQTSSCWSGIGANGSDGLLIATGLPRSTDVRANCFFIRLRCDVGYKGDTVTVLCSIIMVHNNTSGLF